MEDFDKKNSNDLSEEEKFYKKFKNQREVYYCCMMLSIIGIVYLVQYDLLEATTLLNISFAAIILFALSIIFRLLKKLTMSNILCISTVSLIGIVALTCHIEHLKSDAIAKYNQQFLNYIENDSYVFYDPTISDISGLIDVIIANNINDQQVSLTYQDVKYTSSDELLQLKSMLDSSKKYNCSRDYDDSNYIKNITVEQYTMPRALQNTFSGYDGKKIKGSTVEDLLIISETFVKNGSINTDFCEEFNIIYLPTSGEATVVNLYTEDSQSIKDLISKTSYYITKLEKYDSNIYNITITPYKNDL